eukprot:scaffold114180_cov29-Tisochrysis_lutea.AAC.4
MSSEGENLAQIQDSGVRKAHDLTDKIRTFAHRSLRTLTDPQHPHPSGGPSNEGGLGWAVSRFVGIVSARPSAWRRSTGRVELQATSAPSRSSARRSRDLWPHVGHPSAPPRGVHSVHTPRRTSSAAPLPRPPRMSFVRPQTLPPASPRGPRDASAPAAGGPPSRAVARAHGAAFVVPILTPHCPRRLAGSARARPLLGRKRTRPRPSWRACRLMYFG